MKKLLFTMVVALILVHAVSAAVSANPMWEQNKRRFLYGADAEIKPVVEDSSGFIIEPRQRNIIVTRPSPFQPTRSITAPSDLAQRQAVAQQLRIGIPQQPRSHALFTERVQPGPNRYFDLYGPFWRRLGGKI